MLSISPVDGGFQIAKGGVVFKTIHKAMESAEFAAERYGFGVEWAKDPASGEYVGFEHKISTIVVKP